MSWMCTSLTKGNRGSFPYFWIVYVEMQWTEGRKIQWLQTVYTHSIHLTFLVYVLPKRVLSDYFKKHFSKCWFWGKNDLGYLKWWSFSDVLCFWVGEAYTLQLKACPRSTHALWLWDCPPVSAAHFNTEIPSFLTVSHWNKGCGIRISYSLFPKGKTGHSPSAQ